MTEESHPIVIYSSPFCGFCAAAKELLTSKHAEYFEIDIMANPDRRAEMIKRCGRRTVPQIFIATRHIGGYDDLKALDTAGELEPLLDSVASSSN